MTISGDIADANAAEAAYRELRGPDPADLLLTGSQRRYLLEHLEGIAEVLDRAARTSKVHGERTRYALALDAAQRSIDLVKVRA